MNELCIGNPHHGPHGVDWLWFKAFYENRNLLVIRWHKATPTSLFISLSFLPLLLLATILHSRTSCCWYFSIWQVICQKHLQSRWISIYWEKKRKFCSKDMVLSCSSSFHMNGSFHQTKLSGPDTLTVRPKKEKIHFCKIVGVIKHKPVESPTIFPIFPEN